MTLKILNLEPQGYSESARQILDSFGDVIEGPFERGELIRAIDEVDILIVRLGHKIDNEIISLGKKLKIIVSATTGLDHIDLEYASKKGIEVLSLKGETDFLETLTATAELTWGLLLSLLRKLPAATTHVVEGGWERDLFKGFQLKGKTLGVLGYGRLGKIVADYGRSFRMNVLVSDPFVHEVPSWTENVNFEELLNSSDVISIHVPLESETVKLLADEQFKMMKKGAVIINTSRGEIIDEGALLKSLLSNHVAGAALDVLANEVSLSPDWLIDTALHKYACEHDNLLLTPHLGGATMESMRDAEEFMANKLSMYVNKTSDRE